MLLQQSGSRLARAPGSRGRTAFERNVLPGFARWFVEQVDRHRPHFLIPTEAKGARLLEYVLAYARNELGTPIDVPMLYRIALPYVDPERLRNSRVLVLDDALRTGRNLQRHCEQIRSYGTSEVRAVACVADGGEAGHEGVSCYRLVDAPLYREYIWLLTELVIARGLPPEVDHHHFTLQLPERLPVAWREIAAELAWHGRLAFDGPADEEELVSMTLHFPELPGTVSHPPEGAIRQEGVNKTRLFPFPQTDGALVVPISFPALELPAGTFGTLTADTARRLVREWSGRSDSVGELLVDEAHVHDPETVYRMLSTCTEVDLLCGLARTLARVYPADQIELTAQRELFHWLYGEVVGERIAERIDDEIRAALDEALPPSAHPEGAEPPQPLFLDAEVMQTTTAIATRLKDRYDEEARAQGGELKERIGWSLTEVLDAVEGTSPLLASRCCSYGLSMTTLVPYVDVQIGPDGAVEVRRKYRVSETNREGEPFEDRDDHDQQIAEELIAFVAYYVQAKSRRYADEPPDAELVTHLVAILHRLVLEDHNLPIEVRPGIECARIVLRDHPDAETLVRGSSAMFVLRSGGVVASERFRRLLASDRRMRLRLGKSFAEVEGYLAVLLPLLDELDDAERRATLACWAMSTDRRLGLQHVRYGVERALRNLETSLRRLLREEPGTVAGGTFSEARRALSAGRHALELLRSDRLARVRDRWQEPFIREQDLLESLALPREAGAVYAFPAALAELVDAVIPLVEHFSSAAERAWREDAAADAGGDEIARLAIDDCQAIERTVTSLRDEHERVEAAMSGRQLFTSAGETLLRTIATLRALAAATAGAYRGRARDTLPQERDGSRPETVLFLDLSKSFEYAVTHEVTPTHEWKNDGLNIAEQWGRAFGGRRGRDREGDAVWLDFANWGDPAVLCGALIQEHTRALRSIGDITLRWGFRAAIDDGCIRDGDGENALGVCIDRAAKLAKDDASEAAVERLLVTPEAANLCSEALRKPPLAGPGEPVQLIERRDDPAVRFVPYDIAAAEVVQTLAARMRALAERIRQSIPAAPQESPPPDDDPGETDAERDSG